MTDHRYRQFGRLGGGLVERDGGFSRRLVEMGCDWSSPTKNRIILLFSPFFSSISTNSLPLPEFGFSFQFSSPIATLIGARIIDY